MTSHTIPILALLLALTLGATALDAQHGEPAVLLQAAVHTELVEGDLSRAIQLYGDIVANAEAERTIVATALLYMGRSYEKLGSVEAATAYERVVRDYADQSDQATEARARLDALRTFDTAEVSASQVARLLVTDSEECYVFDMSPSPDGTRVAHSDLCSGGLIVRDLESGATMRVVNEWGWGPVWSPDGTRIAFWTGGAVRVLTLETGTLETPAALEGLNLSPRDWSSDGEHLAGALTDLDQSVSTVVVSLRTGNRITLAPQVTEGGDAAKFSPDSRYVAYTDLVGENQDIYVMALEGQERQRITTDPQPDGAPAWSPDGTTIVFQNPNGAWAIGMEGARPHGSPRLVRREPLHGPVAWTANGFYHAARNMVTLPYRIPVDPESGRTRGSGEPITTFVKEAERFAWSPTMDRIALSGWGGTISVAERQMLKSFPIGTEFLINNLWWSGDGREVLFTSAARAMRDKRQTVFGLNPDDGSVRELFPRMDSTNSISLSSDGAQMVFHRVNEGGRQLIVSNPGNVDGRVLASDPHPDGNLYTLWGQPRFSPDGKDILFLRVRQAGQELLTSLWVVGADGSPPRKVVTAPFITAAVWDPSGRFIAYYQEPNATLEKGSLSVLSLETGTVHEILPLPDQQGTVGLRDWSPDGRWIGISRRQGVAEYWVIQDILGQSERRGRR